VATAANHWSKRLQPQPTRRGPRNSAPNVEVMAALWTRATDRDRWLLRMLAEHRVLTTTHITALAFSSPRVARARLQMLHAHRAVFGTRPRVGTGSLPWHWVLDEAGARLLAADDGLNDARQWGWRRDHALAPLSAATLAHTVGVNWLGTHLVQHARMSPDVRVEAWWGEHRCGQLVGDYVNPDGYLHYTDPHGSIEFWVEYDTGTEPHHRLLTKADRYQALTDATGIDLPVLFLLPNPRREATLRRHLTNTAITAATTTPHALAAARGPAGPAWQPLHHTGPRQHPTQLPVKLASRTPLHAGPAAHADRPAPDPMPPPGTRGWAT
jgi:hypothetical protein